MEFWPCKAPSLPEIERVNKNVKCVSGDLFGTYLTTMRYVSFLNTTIAYSHIRHTLHREEGSRHAATVEMLPQQKLTLTCGINTLHGLNLLSTVMHGVAITSQHG